MISIIKNIFRKKERVSLFDSETLFSISVGEICESCHKELDIENGGFSGKPSKCKDCQIVLDRESKLKKLGI